MGDGVSHYSILVPRFCCTRWCAGVHLTVLGLGAGTSLTMNLPGSWARGAGRLCRPPVRPGSPADRAAPAVPVTIHACARQEGTAGSQSATPTRSDPLGNHADITITRPRGSRFGREFAP